MNYIKLLKKVNNINKNYKKNMIWLQLKEIFQVFKFDLGT